MTASDDAKMDVPEALRFEQLVFSGGGTRCFWHGGFAAVVGPAIHLRPKRISAVSGGALSSCAFIGNCEQRLFEIMGEALRERESNVSLSWNEVQETGLTPHQQMYREIVTTTLQDDAVERIADGPSFQVLLSHPPSELVPKLSTLPMMVAYEADLALRSTPHVVAPQSLGANEVLVDARQAARDGKLIDLVCSAAVIPPVFNVQGWEGRPVVDGGMTSKAPLPDPDHGRTLVLLTRRFRNVPDHPERLYVQPSEAVPADKIDFTSRAKIEATWEAGERDGHAFLQAHGLGGDIAKASGRTGSRSTDAASGGR